MKFGMLVFSLSLAVFFSNVTLGEEADGLPKLYAFQNGLGFGSVKEEVEVLSDLDYAGVSQVSGDAAALQDMVATYGKEGLRVRSVYLDAGG